MCSEADKAKAEVEAFKRFIDAAKLPIDFASIESRPPPEPDLRCTHETDGRIAFELVELCDPRIAAAIARESGEYIRTSDPSGRIIAKKLRRKYDTDLPSELLCYTTGRIVTPDSNLILITKLYLKSWRHVFRRAWLHGRKGVYELWKAD